MAARDSENRDLLLAQAIARGLSVPEAADTAGLSERTAYRRLNAPDFREEVSKLRRLAWERAASRLSDVATKAVDTLAQLMESGDEKLKLQAAVKCLELGSSFREILDLEERLSRLEATREEYGLHPAA